MGTAEQGEKSNDLALLSSPRLGREGFPSPSTSSIENHAAQKEAGALGAGRERPAQQAVPAAQGKANTGSVGFGGELEKTAERACPGGTARRDRAGTDRGRDGDGNTVAQSGLCVTLFPVL